MSAPILVTHPVPCHHRPPRAWTERFGHLTGTTSVELRAFADAPQAITRHNHAQIVEAEGRAWVQAGSGIAHDDLRATLEGTDSPERGGQGELRTLHEYLVRSPLCRYERDRAHRTGGLDAARAGTITEGAVERAADAVRAFVDDRIRLHGDAVYLHYERLLFAMPLHASFMTEFPLYPRQTIAASAHRTNRGYIGMTMGGPGWEQHMALPDRLLGDDDALWFANVLPERALATLSRPGLKTHLDEAGRAELTELREVLRPLAQLGETLSLAGDALQPALRTVHDAAARISRQSETAANRSRMLVYAEDARSYDHAGKTMERHALPRLAARQAPPPVDVEALSHLAP
jgi:hypothetical protein